MKHLQIIPDNQIDNTKVEQLSRSLCRYSSLLSRWDKESKRFEKHPFLSFETILKKTGSRFIVTVKDESESVARKAIESTFPKATIRDVEDPIVNAPNHMAVLLYHNHYFLSLRVDKRSNSLLSSLLDALIKRAPSKIPFPPRGGGGSHMRNAR